MSGKISHLTNCRAESQRSVRQQREKISKNQMLFYTENNRGGVWQ